jgi:hypothetical protein
MTEPRQGDPFKHGDLCFTPDGLKFYDGTSWVDPPNEDEKDKKIRALEKELKTLRAIQKHSICHAGPCVLRILREFFVEPKAYEIAIEHTCFPMDCATASWQALSVLTEYCATGEIRPRESTLSDVLAKVDSEDEGETP